MGETIQSRWIAAMSKDCHMWFPAGKGKEARRPVPWQPCYKRDRAEKRQG